MSRPSRLLEAGSLGRLAAEFMIIVVGVLTALGADAWWTEREERIEYEEAVATILATVDANLASLAGQRVLLSDRIDTMEVAIEWIRSPESASRQQLELTTTAFFGVPHVIVLDGGLEATRETAVWSRLPPGARTLLARIPQVAALDVGDEAYLRESYVRLGEIVEEYGGWQGLLPRDFVRDEIDLDFRSSPGDLDGLIRDDRFEHIGIGALFLTANAIARLDAVVIELEELREILEAELR